MKHSKLSLLLISCLFLFFIFSPSLAFSPEPSSVKVKGTKNFDIGDGTKTAIFDAVVSPSDADQTVTWKSSDKTVATVNKYGKVTVKKSGTATITATAKNGVTGQLDITVISKVKPGSLEIKTKPSSVAEGKAIKLKYTFNQYAEPDNTNVIWKSLNNNIATVDSNGKVSGLAIGTAKIKACSAENKDVCSTVTINVNRPAKSIIITGDSTPIDIGKTGTGTLQLKAEVGPYGCTTDVTWASNNTNVATVNSKGLVTATGTGTAIITATTADGTKLSATFKTKVVSKVQPDSLVPKYKFSNQSTYRKFTDTKTYVAKGKTINIDLDFNQKVKPDNQGFTLTTSNTDIASVDSNKSSAKFLRFGEVQISICSKENKNICFTRTFVVQKPAESVSVSISGGSKTIDIGGTGAVKYKEKLTATVKPSDISQKVTWESSDPTIIFVNENGKGALKVKKLGEVTITATTTDGTNKSGSITLKVVSKVQPNSLKVTGDINSVLQGESIKLKTKFDQKKQPENKAVKWESSDKTIATVNENGEVKGVKVGKVTIKACSKETTSICGTKEISVTGASIKGDSTIDIGGGNKAKTLEVVLSSSDKAENHNWKWEVTSGGSFVELEDIKDKEDNIIKGKQKVTGKAVGKAVITATAQDDQDDNDLTASFEVKVISKVQPNSLKIKNYKKSPFVIIVGKSRDFESYFDETIQKTDPDNPDVIWSSTVKSVARVDKNGTVTGLMSGKAAIKVCSEENEDICSSIIVEIYKKRASDVEISGKHEVQKGKKITLTATVTPSSARQVVKWASSDNAVATVDENGIVKGIKAGTANITATTTDGSKITTVFSVTVK